MKVEAFFDREYFDSGEENPRRRKGYIEYSFSSIYPDLEMLASRLEKILKPRRILDVGCAKGFLVLAFRNMGMESYGVDISDYALGQAPDKIRRYLMKADLNTDRTPFDTGTFDLITATSVLHHLNFPNALREMRRVIADHGILFVQIPYTKASDRKYVGPCFVEVQETSQRDEEYWIKEVQSYGFEFMCKMTNDNYSSLINERLERDLKSGRSLKYMVGRRIHSVPKLGRWVLEKHYRSKIVFFLFFRAR